MIDFFTTEVRLFVALVMIFGATYLDVKRCEIHDIVWIIFGTIAILFVFQSGDHVFLVKTDLSVV